MSQTSAEECEAGLTGSASPCFARDFSRIPIRPLAAGAIQTKLAINEPGDEYEREADRVAEDMVRMPEPRQPLPDEGYGGRERPPLQAARVGPDESGREEVLPIVHDVLRSSGRPLDDGERTFFETRFGHDLSRVRVHTDEKAAESARALNARAFTVGSHVVFAAGQYDSVSSTGKRLLAHELTHTLQQEGSQHGVAQAGTIQRQPEPAQQPPDAGPGQTTTTTPSGGAPPADYGAVLRKVAVDKVWLVSDPNHARDTLIDKLDKGEAVTLTDLGLGEKFNQGADSKRKWWKVKVFVGAHQDKEGWVMQALLGRSYKVKKAGTRMTGKLGEGKVHVDTGQVIEAEPAAGFSGVGFSGDNVFSVTYEGKDAERMRWLQFAWREIVGVDDKGNSTAKTGPVTTGVGTYQLTEGGTWNALGTPIKKENFNTDSKSAIDPFADAGGGSVPGTADRTAESTSFFDQPAPALDLVKEMFDGGAKAVVSRAHYPKFLVEDGKTVRYHTIVSVEWKFNDPKQVDKPPKGLEKAAAGGRASALPPLMAERLHDQYPAFKDLK